MSWELDSGFFSLVPGICKKLNSSVLLTLLLLIFLLSLITCGCTSQGNISSKQTPESFIIACTLPPQEEFIRAVGGENITVLVMVPPGASPHTFEPVPSQIAGLESADLYLYIGSGLEFENRWLDRIRKMYPDLPLINLSENITFIDGEIHHHGETGDEHYEDKRVTDPHVWLSIRNAIEMVHTTCRALKELNPENRDLYELNGDNYINQLNSLDCRIRTELSDLPSRKILVYHPAFGYFCQDYNLTQISVEENGKEPSAKTLATIIDEARNEHVSYIFTEPEVSSRGAETLASEINATIILVSPLSGRYLENLQNISDHIAGIS